MGLKQLQEMEMGMAMEMGTVLLVEMETVAKLQEKGLLIGPFGCLHGERMKGDAIHVHLLYAKAYLGIHDTEFSPAEASSLSKPSKAPNEDKHEEVCPH